MADTVLAYVNQHNRPFSAQNVADALGKQGIKKGLSQKYLDTLVEQGKLNIKEAGKQKVSELAARGGALPGRFHTSSTRRLTQAPCTTGARPHLLSPLATYAPRRRAHFTPKSSQEPVKSNAALRWDMGSVRGGAL